MEGSGRKGRFRQICGQRKAGGKPHPLTCHRPCIYHPQKGQCVFLQRLGRYSFVHFGAYSSLFPGFARASWDLPPRCEQLEGAYRARAAVRGVAGLAALRLRAAVPVGLFSRQLLGRCFAIFAHPYPPPTSPSAWQTGEGARNAWRRMMSPHSATMLRSRASVGSGSVISLHPLAFCVGAARIGANRGAKGKRIFGKKKRPARFPLVIPARGVEAKGKTFSLSSACPQ